MSHCHDEHDHSHDHSDGAHDHSDEINSAFAKSLYQQIDFDAITTLNESLPNAGTHIVRKTWAQRLDNSPILQSDADEQLLIHVPFTAQIRLHSIMIRTPPDTSAPLTMHIYSNHDNLDFDSVSELKPIQTLSLSQTSEVQEINVKRALFGTVRSLDLFIQSNWGGDETIVEYLGFSGEWMQINREPVNVLYESAANPRDHKMMAGVEGEMGRLNSGGGHGM